MESLSYTGRDNEDIRQSLVDLVPQLTDDWRDFSESDLGITIIELIAGAQDMQNFYLDNQTFETYIDTAMQDKNIRSLLRAMNYRVPLMVSSKGEVTLKFLGALGDYISVPQYTQFKCSEVPNVIYITTERVTGPAGAEFLKLPVTEGEVRSIQYSRSELIQNLTSTNNVSRRIYLNDKFVADKSVSIIQEGYEWEEVDDALLKYRGGRYFSVHKDPLGNVYVLMSVNFLDLLPVDDLEKITITYIRTQGTKGLVNAYQIDAIVDSPELITLIERVYNEEATYGAADEPNLQYAKLLARDHAKTMGRYITIEDYANGVATEPIVMYSVVKDWKTTDLVNRPFTVFVWAVDLQGNNLGLEDQKSIIEKFKESGITAVSVEYQQTEFVYFDVEVTVTLRPVTEAEKTNIVGIIEKYIKDSLAPKEIDYGGRLSISILTSSIYTLSPYLKSVVVNNPTEDVESTEIQLLRLRDVKINVEGD